MKNNAFIQEQRMSSRTREDSDEVDEHQFDQSIEENDSVFHENCKNSEKTQNDRKLLAAKAGGVIGGNSQRPKNLEVCCMTCCMILWNIWDTQKEQHTDNFSF